MFKPIIMKVNNDHYQVELVAIFLNVIAFIALIASFSDGLEPVKVALLIWIYIAIRYPYNPIEKVVMKEPPNDDLDAL